MGPAALPLMAVFTVASAVTSYQSQKKQAAAQGKMAEAQRKEMETRQKIADMKARRERLQTIRKARVARMTMEAQAARGGGLDSTAYAGASGSVTSQAAGSIGTSTAIGQLAREQTIFNINASQEAQGLMNQASNWAGMQTIFSAGAQIASGYAPKKVTSSTDASIPFANT